jgi:hypothetical protein
VSGTSRHNLLVVLLADGSEGQLRRAVAERSDELRAVHVAAPARVGALEWLDEDEARQHAHVRVLAAEWTLADQAQVQGEAGDVDPV